MTAKCPSCNWRLPLIGPFRNEKAQPFECPECRALIRYSAGFPFASGLAITVPASGAALLYSAPDIIKLIAAAGLVPLVFLFFAIERLILVEPGDVDQRR